MRKAATLAAVLIAAVLLGVPVLSGLKQRLAAEGQAVASAPASDAPLQNDEALGAPPPQRLPCMTSEQFFQVQHGMTYSECVRVIGVEGSAADPARSQAGGVTAAYTWSDPDGAKEFVLGFRDGRLASKSMGMSHSARTTAQARQRAIEAQTSVIGEAEVQRLEEAARAAGHAVVITLEEFNRVRPGMTYEECAGFIGTGNPMAELYAEQRRAAQAGRQSLGEAYHWRNPGGYYAELAFHNGRLTAKKWKQGPEGAGASVSSRGGIRE